MLTNGKEAEVKGLKTVAELMCVAARTAPKGNGRDNLVTMIVEGETKDRIAAEMRRICKEEGIGFFGRDANNVDASPVAVLIGTKISPIDCPYCGFCGFENCKENQENNGVCFFNANDLGIATGSAVAVAADHRCDNRILFSMGKAALNLGLFEEGVKAAWGIPLSASGKSPFFDRGESGH